jgi:hypothetical protein
MLVNFISPMQNEVILLSIKIIYSFKNRKEKSTSLTSENIKDTCIYIKKNPNKVIISQNYMKTSFYFYNES